MKFSDFFEGQIIETQTHRVDQESILEFAKNYDPQWFHCDPQLAQDGPFSGLIASGWHTCGIAMRLMVESALHDSESFASPGLNYLRWKNPVRPGDVLQVRAEVLEVRRSESKPNLGILRWRWRMQNQDDVEVLDLEAISLFELSRNS